MMEQYIEIKAANPDCLLFYRMGDFYELFFEDAEVAARALGIVLTKRGKHLGRDIPMCGVPVHRADEYLHRLIALGHRVAVCEQLEDPAEAQEARRQERGAARRHPPGHARHADRGHAARRPAQQLPARDRARARLRRRRRGRFALAWIDISTGEFRIAECDRAGLAAEIARLEPGEIIVSDALYGDAELAPYLRSLPAVTPLARDVFDGATAERRLVGLFRASPPPTASARCRGSSSPRPPPASPMWSARSSASARRSSPPVREAAGRDACRSTRRRAANLELVRTLAGERRGSLLAAIDRTVTAAGARLLAQRLAAPLTDPAAIARAARRGRVLRRPTRGCAPTCAQRLAAAPDLARALARLVVGRGGPRDLAAIRDGIVAAAALAGELEQLREHRRRDRRRRSRRCAGPIRALAARACRRRSPTSLPLFKRDGGFVRAGYDAALDEARALRDESRR